MTSSINNIMPIGDVTVNGERYVAVLYYYGSSGVPLAVTPAMQDERIREVCLKQLQKIVGTPNYNGGHVIPLLGISGKGFHFNREIVSDEGESGRTPQQNPYVVNPYATDKQTKAWNKFLSALQTSHLIQPSASSRTSSLVEETGKEKGKEPTPKPGIRSQMEKGPEVRIIKPFSDEEKETLFDSIDRKYRRNNGVWEDPADLTQREQEFLAMLGLSNMSLGSKIVADIAHEITLFTSDYLSFKRSVNKPNHGSE